MKVLLKLIPHVIVNTDFGERKRFVQIDRWAGVPKPRKSITVEVAKVILVTGCD